MMLEPVQDKAKNHVSLKKLYFAKFDHNGNQSAEAYFAITLIMLNKTVVVFL